MLNWSQVKYKFYTYNFAYIKIHFIISLSVQYLLFLYRYFKKWRKNPHWSFSCCLALLLPLNDLQGELRGLSGKNILNTQLQTGPVGKPSVAASAKESGVLSLTLEEGSIDDDKTTVLPKLNGKVVECSKQKYHRGTQTEAFTLPMAALTVHESLEGIQEISVSTNNTNKNLHHMNTT